jgi:hypothetical protein
MKKQHNFIGNNISRLGMEYIRLATKLHILHKIPIKGHILIHMLIAGV